MSKALFYFIGVFLLAASFKSIAFIRTPVDFSGSDTVNVMDYGAMGDGVHDETTAFRKAIKYAMDNHRQLVLIPAGRYLINSKDDKTNVSISLQGPYSSKDSISLKFVGESNKTVIISNLQENVGPSSTRIFSFTGFWYDVQFKNIAFESAHPLTMGQTGAISTTGVPNAPNKRLTITNCSFSGFCPAIGLNGAEDATISYCTFKAPRGHDDAQLSSKPATFIWLISNQNGIVANTRVLHCKANGFTGSDISATKTQSPMDNFLLGNPNGCDVQYNSLQNFGEELIGISGNNDFKNVCTISNNNLDCSFPLNSKVFYNNYSAKVSNYGIRIEAVNVKVINNTLLNATGGILQYAQNEKAYANVIFNNWEISNNRIYISDINGVSPGYGISLVQNSNYAQKQLKVSIIGNKVYVKKMPSSNKFSIFKIANFENCNFLDNHVYQNNVDISAPDSDSRIYQLKNVKKLSLNGRSKQIN